MDDLYIYKMLEDYENMNPLRMHVPGRHGKAGGELDITELLFTPGLFSNDNVIERAQREVAKVYRSRECFFITAGATVGIFTMLASSFDEGDYVIVDRGCHRSVISAMALLGLNPVFIYPQILEDFNIACGFSEDSVDRALKSRPEAKGIIITAPTYYGVIPEGIEYITSLREKGLKVLCDGAHGAHLPLMGYDIYRKFDMYVLSAHKTLPVATGGAYLFANNRCDRSEILKKLALFHTSSPSYEIMAMLEAAPIRTDEEKAATLKRNASILGRIAKKANGENGVLARCFEPMRLVINMNDAKEAHLLLCAKYGIYPEMCDGRNIVFISTEADSEEDLKRLERAVSEICELNEKGKKPRQNLKLLPAKRKINLRNAVLGRKIKAKIKDTAGLVCGEIIVKTPPCIPLLIPGEVITEGHIKMLLQNGFDIEYNIDIVEEGAI